MKCLIIFAFFLHACVSYSQTECAKDVCTKGTLAKVSGAIAADNVKFICFEVPKRFTEFSRGVLSVNHPSFEDECRWETTTFTLAPGQNNPKESVFVMLTLVDGKPQERGWILLLTH